MRRDVCSGRKDKQEIVQVMREIPSMQSLEDPMEGFREEVEYSWSST
jgi:hypothetical protein